MSRCLCCIMVGILLTSGIARSALAQKEAGGLPIGSKAPDFELLDLDGKTVALESYRGKPVLINFWAFWCDTWEKEMPQLRELCTRQNELGFRLLAVSVDGTRLPEFTIRSKGNVPFPVLLDISGRITEEYGIHHVPMVLILDGNGLVRYSYVAWPGNQVVLNHLRRLSVVGTESAESHSLSKPKQILTVKKIRVQRRH